MTKIREVLEELVKWVEAEKKKLASGILSVHDIAINKEFVVWNACCDHLVKLIKGEE